jgi:hypothetical protein
VTEQNLRLTRFGIDPIDSAIHAGGIKLPLVGSDIQSENRAGKRVDFDLFGLHGGTHFLSSKQRFSITFDFRCDTLDCVMLKTLVEFPINAAAQDSHVR